MFLFLSCTPKDVSDSSPPPEIEEPDPLFTEAELIPPFYHVNSVWAGVALLDYNNDDWLDIFLTNGHSHADALYHNNGDGTFTDVSAQAGVNSLEENGAVVAGDLNNDGSIDLIVNTPCSATTLSESGEFLWDGNKIIYHNNGDGTFSRIDFNLPYSDEEHIRHCTFSMTLADMNHDGFLDLIVADGHDPDVVAPWAFDKFHPGGENIIFFNDGTGTFDRISQQFGNEGSFVSAHIDFNEDGRMDLLFGHSGQEVEVYLQQEDGSFKLSPTASESGRGLWMGLAIADFDGDLDWEIYATNEGLSPFLLGYDNLLYGLPNKSPHLITSLPDQTSPLEIQPVLQWLNPFHSMLDRNSDNGLALTAQNWDLDSNELLPGDLFTQINGRYGFWENPEGLQRIGWGWGTVPIDVDGDGWMDVAFNGNSCAAPMSIIHSEDLGAGPGGLLLNINGSSFKDITWSAGVANIDIEGRFVDGRGIATGDLNNDGFNDLVFANRSYNPSDTNPLLQEVGIPRIWLSTERENHYLQIQPVGVQSNRDAIGASVLVEAQKDGQQYAWKQWIRPGGGLASSSESLASFGIPSSLFAASDQVRVEVTFPSGEKVVKNNIGLNQRITILESE